MQERTPKNQRVTTAFIRGNWLSPGDTIAQADVPASLPGLPENAPRNRLGLAEWLVNPENPLTARVMVNRFWEQLFGRGIVETVEDFGTQGAKPSNPELLDWLAVHFQEDLQWRVKGLLKTLVMSSAYQQQAHVTEEKLARDPENRLLSRGPREQVRDQALAVSGLLSTKMYGPPVMPPQPDKVWQSVYNSERWETSVGPDKYRRAIYTYWKRTSPYPSMIAFDSPSREFCLSRRIDTTTPLQALVTLNDTVFVEAAGNLARKMVAAGDDLVAQITFGYEQAFFEPPSPQTLETLKRLYHEALKQQQRTPSQDFVVEQVKYRDGSGPERQAMTIVASAVMNLDAFITK